MHSTPAPPNPAALAFVEAVLRSGLIWADLVDRFAEDLEDKNPWPGESPAQVIVEMIAGSARAGTSHLPPGELERATLLLGLANERILKDVSLASRIAGRRKRGHAGA